MTVDHLLYLHGFRSSPQSAKARFVAAKIAADHPGVHWLAPQLPPSPRAAVDELLAAVATWPVDRMAVVGSSLGGFYAWVLAERIGCRAVLLNPAVDPARDLARQVGEQTAWHGDERFDFEPGFIDELAAMTPAKPTRPERFFAVIATGDEVLSWREMSDRFAGSPMRIVDGSDHALSDFEHHWPAVEAFLFTA